MFLQDPSSAATTLTSNLDCNLILSHAVMQILVLLVYFTLFRSFLMVRISLFYSLSAFQGSVLGLGLGYVLTASMTELGVCP